MNIVVVGHVDHGKSTVIGRLLVDTGSLPQGKLEQVRALCRRNARPFEYAFLLDALKDEQAQGITIDTARCFFKTEKRDYIIIDAPGHVEFLKNMVSGAARAEAALLVIDAHEGIMENSLRHGYLVSMLGIRQIVVLVNKMDLVGYSQKAFDTVVAEYRAFLDRIHVSPLAFVPISARYGDNLAASTAAMPWYNGPSVLSLLDGVPSVRRDGSGPLRFPVQDVYKFTEDNDDRRIVAGTVENGTLRLNDEVIFLPSGKRSIVVSIEGYNESPKASVDCGIATGVTLCDELYLRRGEIMCRVGDPLPIVTRRFVSSVFWMGRSPLVMGRKYKLKIGTAAVQVRLAEVRAVIDAADLSSGTGKRQLDRHDVAECVFETMKPIAVDPISEIEVTGRFVIVDGYDIAGGGIIICAETEGGSWINDHVRSREVAWERGLVTLEQRMARNGHKSKCIVLCGDDRRTDIGRLLERMLFDEGCNAYFLGLGSLRAGLDADEPEYSDSDERFVYRIGELSRIITDTGTIFITALGDVDASDLAIIRKLNEPASILVVSLGKNLTATQGADLTCDGGMDEHSCAAVIVGRLRDERIVQEYSI